MEIIFELIFQLVFEILIDGLCLGYSDKKKKKNKKPIGPFFEFFSYCIFGAIAGALSLLILPHQLIESQTLIYLNLIITPVIAGVCMAYIGFLRKKKGKNTIRLDTFLYGFSFALVMTLVRFWFGT